MVDIYSLGNVFYCLLTRLWPFENLRLREVYKKIRAGERPSLTDDIVNSTDPSIMILKTAMELAQAQSPKDRPSARELVNMLTTALNEIQSINQEGPDRFE